MGYLLATQDLSRKTRYIIYALGLFAILYRYGFTYFQSREAGKLIKITWGYMQFHTFFLTAAVFVFVKNIDWDKFISSKVAKTLALISSCSFGVYLFHMVIIHYEKALLGWDPISWKYRTFGILATYLVSLFVIFVLKQIPIIRRFVA